MVLYTLPVEQNNVYVFKNLNFTQPFVLSHALELSKQCVNFSVTVFPMLGVLLPNGCTAPCCRLCSNSVDLIYV